MTKALRWVRAVFGFVAAWQVITLLPVLTWPLSPSSVDTGMVLMLVLKVIALVGSLWLYDWLRTVIIERHARVHGTPHPLLSKSRLEL